MISVVFRQKMAKLLLLTVTLVMLLAGNTLHAAQIDGSYGPAPGDDKVPIGGYKTYYVPISAAPSNAIITNVEAKFTYTAYGVVQNYVSCRFNKGSDPGPSGGVSLVSQGNLPEGNPGAYGYISFSDWNGQSVNSDYFFRFATTNGSPYEPTIHGVFVRITYETKPPPPTLISPSGDIPANTDITFLWNISPGAGRYRLKICTDQAMSNQIPDSPFEAPYGHTSYMVSASYFTVGTTYYWQVGAIAPGDIGGWGDYGPSPPWSITVVNTSSFPILISPLDGSTINDKYLTFTWTSVNGALGYEIRSDNDCNFISPEIDNYYIDGGAITTKTFESHLSDNTYCWKVRAKFGENDYSDWSETWQVSYQLPVHSEPIWTPLYRLYKGGAVKNHYYTTISAHRNDFQNEGYNYERIEGYISDRKFNDPDCGYLFALWNETDQDHFYTSDEVEKNNAISSLGYSYEGIIGFIYTQPFDWGTSFYRLYHSSDKDHFYTISKFERDNALNAYGYAEDGGITDSEGRTVVGYISSIGILNPESRLKFNALAGFGTNTGNGNFNYSHTDLQISGIDIPVVFSRAYNSLNFNKDGPLGYGWSHSFQMRLYDDWNKVYVFWPDGHADKYEREGGNMTEANPARGRNPGCYDTLYISTVGSDTFYNITKKDQTQFVLEMNSIGTNTPFDMAQLTTVKNRNDNLISLTYDENNGYLTHITDTAGRVITVDNDDLGRIERIIDPIERTVCNFTYDNENLAGVTDARGNTTQFVYDEPNAKHLLTKIILPENQTLTNQYDQDFIVSSQNFGGTTFDFSFNPDSTSVTAANDIITYDIGDDYQLDKITDPLTYGSLFLYDDPINSTKPTAVINKNEYSTYFTYDDGANDGVKKILSRGNALTVTNALEESTIFSYDDKNNLLKKTDALNRITRFQYDASSNLIKTTYPVGGIYNFTYTSFGQLEKTIDPNNHTVTNAYDAHGNLTTVTNHLNYYVAFTYDGVGKKLTGQDQSGSISNYNYDPNDNLIQIINAAKKTISNTYDKNNNPVTISNTKRNNFSYSFNNRNMLASETDPIGKIYRYEYDGKGNLEHVIDPDNKTLTNVYDANNRLTDIKYNGIATVSNMQYDSVGNLESLTYQNKDTSFDYDALNRITSVTDGFGKGVSYQYDSVGNRTRRIYPGDKTVVYEYDDDNRLEKVTDWLGGITIYAYDDAGLLKSSTLPNQTKTLYTYDAANRLTTLSNLKSDESVISSYIYSLDAIGNHRQVEKDVPLITPIIPAEDITYTPDAANRLTSVDGVAYTHDNRGNLTGTGSGNIYTYDFAYRLTSVTIGGNNIEYMYDGLGNRIARTENSVQTRYVLDLNGSMSQVLAETDSVGNILNYYIYGHGLIYKITDSGQRYYYHYDSRGSTVAISDNSQNLVNKYAYDIFGEVLASEEAVSDNPFQYVGKYGVMDEGNGLLFMRARYFNVATGRFLSKDPIGFDGGDLNLYAYVGNNAISNVDPLGLKISIFLQKGDPYEEMKFIVNKALKNLMKDPLMNDVITSLLDSDKVYTIQLNNQLKDNYSTATRTISWDYRAYMVTDNGDRISPYLLLGHELGHAYYHEKKGSFFSLLAGWIPTGDDYDYISEWWVIRNIEAPVAYRSGEGVRKNHRGGLFH